MKAGSARRGAVACGAGELSRMSGFGYKQTFRGVPTTSALPPIADIGADNLLTHVGTERRKNQAESDQPDQLSYLSHTLRVWPGRNPGGKQRAPTHYIWRAHPP